METRVKLNTVDDVKEFVRLAGKCDFDIDVFYNRIIIDGKSILGVLSLDLTNVLTVRCYGDCESFMAKIAKFAPQEAVA